MVVAEHLRCIHPSRTTWNEWHSPRHGMCHIDSASLNLARRSQSVVRLNVTFCGNRFTKCCVAYRKIEHKIHLCVALCSIGDAKEEKTKRFYCFDMAIVRSVKTSRRFSEFLGRKWNNLRWGRLAWVGSTVWSIDPYLDSISYFVRRGKKNRHTSSPFGRPLWCKTAVEQVKWNAHWMAIFVWPCLWPTSDDPILRALLQAMGLTKGTYCSDISFWA